MASETLALPFFEAPSGPRTRARFLSLKNIGWRGGEAFSREDLLGLSEVEGLPTSGQLWSLRAKVAQNCARNECFECFEGVESTFEQVKELSGGL